MTTPPLAPAPLWPGRSGLALVGTLLALTVVLVCVGVAVDLAMLGAYRQELQALCERTATAAVRQLHDPAVLYAGPEQARYRGRATARIPYAVQAAQEAMAGAQVQGWCRSDRATGVTLTLGRLLGLGQTQLHVRVRATVDRRVAGFRPTADCPVPMVPLGAWFQGHRQSWWAQCNACPARPGVNDCFRVSSQGGVTLGSDGIPELKLIVPVASATSSQLSHNHQATAWLLQLGEGSSWADFERQVLYGLTEQDLRGWGGRLPSGAQVPTRPLEPGAAQWVQGALNRIRGRRRVWPLVVPAADPSRLNVVFFGAAVLVDAQLRADRAALVLWVQPCLLHTPTAITHPRAVENPWIGKIVLGP